MLRVVGIITLLVLMVVVFTPVSAQEYAPGDSIFLVEREIHIPAHPDAGDPFIHFRFASGSAATVLSIDSQTGWIEIRGEAVNGEERTGWITARYISAKENSAPESEIPEPKLLDWCPDKGSVTPHPSGRLRIATWNIENLHADIGQSTYEGDDPSTKRIEIDYERIRCYIRLFNPDILAVQEVDGIEALERVVDTDVYDIFVSTRPQDRSINGKQNTGFVVRQGLAVQHQPDFKLLDIEGDGDLRYGTRIDLTHNDQTIALMSVHLKSGCFDSSSNSTACSTLMDQVPVLEEWIDDKANSPTPFILLGDFNRRFNQLDDEIWLELDDQNPPNADLTTITDNMPISCRDNEFTEFIDHIVFDARSIEWVDQSSFRHVTYRQQDKEVWSKISDHCPVVVELWLPQEEEE